MRGTIRSLSAFLRLSRITGVFATIGNVWFLILWTRGVDEERAWALARSPTLAGSGHLALELLAGALTGFGLYGFGTGLNDILDWRRDRHFRPDRPLPAGDVTLAKAVIFVAATLLAAVLGSTAFGVSGVLATLLVAGAVLAFNAAAKFIPAIGFVVLGLIYAAHMLIPNPHVRFLWPAWLVMTHMLILAGVTHTMARKVPALSRRGVVIAAAGWAFWSGMLLWLGARRAGSIWPDWVEVWAPIVAGALAALFIAYAARKVALHGRTAKAAEKLWRYGSLWLQFYACAWLAGAGLYDALLIVGVWTLAGMAAAGFAREIYGIIERPLGYRW